MSTQTITVAWFRFSQTNPITGRPFAASRYAQLPTYAAVIVEDWCHVTRDEWDQLVEAGQTGEVVAANTAHPVLGTRKTCDQCRGSGFAPEYRASTADRCGLCRGNGRYVVIPDAEYLVPDCRRELAGVA